MTGRFVDTFRRRTYVTARIGRRTQVVKGEVCKTSMHRFESGRRLFPAYA